MYTKRLETGLLKYYILSLILHLLPFLLIFIAGVNFTAGSENGDNGIGYGDNKKIIEMGSGKKDIDTLSVSIVELPNKSIEENDKKDCPSNMYFGGTGVTHINGLITKVYKDYPAYKAGIKENDIIVSPPIDKIKGEVGSVLKLEIKRNDKILKFNIIREKICYNNIDLINP